MPLLRWCAELESSDHCFQLRYATTVIDSHCHLASADFDTDLEAVIARAESAGVKQMVCISDSLAEAEKCLQIANKYDHIFYTVGVHPHCAKDWQAGDETRVQTLMSASKKAKAVGEIGLDYHYNFSEPATQQKAFREQLRIAKDLGVPAVVHCREAVSDLRRIIEEVDCRQFVIHCCTESFTDISWVLDRGGLLSFTGIATFPKSELIRDCIRQTPLDRLMIETDAPYLAPIPHRGKRNEPAYVAEVLKLVAELKNVSVVEAEQVITKTTKEFFGI